MQYSTNFNMNKPELSEQYRLTHWNENTDIIDTEMQAIRSGTDDVMKATLLNFCYPIGSIYWSGVATNPHDLFGGTWVQIKDCFVWAKGDNDTLDATGGEKTHTLTSTEMPSHTHTFTGSAVTSGANNRGHTHSVTASGTISGGTYSFSGSAVTSGANNRGHTHTLNNGNTSSAGTITTAGFRGVAVTSGAMSQHSSGSFDIRKTDIGNVIVAQDGVVCTASDVGSDYSQVWSKSTSDKARRITINVAHTHSVTANGYIYGTTDGESQNHTHSVTANGTVSVTTNPTFSGSAVTSGAESQNHTHSVTASGTNANSGGGEAHNNMPPYVVKYCWQRTA